MLFEDNNNSVFSLLGWGSVTCANPDELVEWDWVHLDSVVIQPEL